MTRAADRRVYRAAPDPEPTVISRNPTILVLLATLACSAAPPEAATIASPPETFTGTWRSVTPSYEFVGLSVYSKSSALGDIGVRLTYSGVAFDGAGRIDGDSLLVSLTVDGTSQPSGVLVARTRGGDTLHAERRSSTAGEASLLLDFVREQP